MSKKTKEPGAFGWKDKFGYMMGDVGCNLVLTMANSYLLVFYTKVMGVSAAIVGTIFMLARFVDAFTDMAVGRIVDTHVGKSGDRFRPWIIYGSIPLVICSCLMYNYFLADAAMTVKVIWLVITYILFGSICYTAVNIPYGAMSVVLTDDSGERASLSTWRNVGAQIGGVILGIVIPLAVYVKDEDGNSVASGPRFFMVAVVLGILAFCSLFICWKCSVERIKLKNKETVKNENSMEIIIGCLKDPVLLLNFGYSVFIYAASQVFLAFNQYLFLDYFGNTSLSGLASLVLFAGMMLAAPFASTLSKRFGKKEVALFGMILSSVTYLIMFVARVSNPYLYFVGVFLAFFGLGLLSMVSYAIGNDCIDSHYLSTGVRAEGTIYAMNSFVRKLAGAICTGIGGWGLALIGYNELATVQTANVQQSIFTLSVGMTMACFIISLIFLIPFPLNKKKIEENNKLLTEMRKNQV